MAGVFDNFPEVRAVIKQLAQSWDFRGRGRYKTLGEDALDLVAESIVDRTVLQQLQPNGEPLAPLAESTLERKRKLGYPETISIETAAMMAFGEVAGERTVERRWARMEYGTDDETKLKSEWFQEGNAAQNRPPRPFYELDDRTCTDLDSLFEEVLERNIRDLGG